MNQGDIPARVTATVIEMPPGIDAGAHVAAGQVIARLDDADFARQVEISTQVIADLESQLNRLAIEETSWTERVKLVTEDVALVQAEFNRVKDAAERGAAKQREVDLARQALIAVIRAEVAAKEEFDKIPARRTSLQAQKTAQEAQLRLARQNLERCTIASPINGILEAVDVELGENALVGTRIARVVSIAHIEIPIQLPAGARSDIALGDEVLIHATGASVQSWHAALTRISPEDDAATRTLTVFAEVHQQPDADASMLAPGSFVRAIVTARDAQPRWVVPRRSLQGDRILLVRDGRVLGRNVRVDFSLEAEFPQFGVPDRHWIVLLDQLASGDQVVLNATRSLIDGSPAHAVPAAQWHADKQAAVAAREATP
jgi:RND family efflux transporter MFP subunit